LKPAVPLFPDEQKNLVLSPAPGDAGIQVEYLPGA